MDGEHTHSTIITDIWTVFCLSQATFDLLQLNMDEGCRVTSRLVEFASFKQQKTTTLCVDVKLWHSGTGRGFRKSGAWVPLAWGPTKASPRATCWAACKPKAETDKSSHWLVQSVNFWLTSSGGTDNIQTSESSQTSFLSLLHRSTAPEWCGWMEPSKSELCLPLQAPASSATLVVLAWGWCWHF